MTVRGSIPSQPTTMGGFRCKIGLVQHQDGAASGDTMLMEDTIESPIQNQTVVLSVPAKSVSRYMSPLAVRFTAVNVPTDRVPSYAVVTVRFRRGS